MPHFVIECSGPVLQLKPAEEILQTVYETAVASGLFAIADIKARIRPYDRYITAGTDANFLHVFGHIMEGRSVEQKATLSRQMVTRLNALLPEVPVISMNIVDFEKATYCNKKMI